MRQDLKTVGELRRFLQMLPDDTPLAIWHNDYDERGNLIPDSGASLPRVGCAVYGDLVDGTMLVTLIGEKEIGDAGSGVRP